MSHTNWYAFALVALVAVVGIASLSNEPLTIDNTPTGYFFKRILPVSPRFTIPLAPPIKIENVTVVKAPREMGGGHLIKVTIKNRRNKVLTYQSDPLQDSISVNNRLIAGGAQPYGTLRPGQSYTFQARTILVQSGQQGEVKVELWMKDPRDSTKMKSIGRVMKKTTFP